MVDRLTKEHRSWNMSRIKGRDTRPEKVVRSMLHNMGYRFRLHRKDLPGTPDIVMPRYTTVIQVHGCYWHRHHGCKNASTPKSNTGFWKAKFAQTVKRDRKQKIALQKLGWYVVVIWECQTENPANLRRRIESVMGAARKKSHN